MTATPAPRPATRDEVPVLDLTPLNKGEALGPLMAQRLANGNTFLANQEHLVEVDRDGKVVFTLARPGGQHVEAIEGQDSRDKG